MNLRSIMDRVSYSEWAILRSSQEQKLGRISISRQQQSGDVPLWRALATGCRRPSFRPVAAAIGLAAVFVAPSAQAKGADAGDWIDTWTASPQPIWDAEFFAPVNVPRALRNQTIRQIIGATLTPFEDTFKGTAIEGYYNVDKEQKRQAVNQWIRSSGAFDGLIDFDAVARDPNRPAHILAAFDSGDHLHPQDDGYKAMADSIDLKMLSPQP